LASLLRENSIENVRNIFYKSLRCDHFEVIIVYMVLFMVLLQKIWLLHRTIMFTKFITHCPSICYEISGIWKKFGLSEIKKMIEDRIKRGLF